MPGDYSVAEIGNANYGYTTKASGAATIASGTITKEYRKLVNK